MRALDGTTMKPSINVEPQSLGGYERALFYELSGDLDPAYIEIGEAKGMSKDEMREFSVEGRIVHRVTRNLNVEHLVRMSSGAIAQIDVTGERTSIRVAAEDPDVARTALAKLTELVGPREVRRGAKLPANFWCKSPDGPQAIGRELDINAWVDAQGNYSSRTNAALEFLADDFEPDRSGLILWNGEPGTGKSRAVEALANSWRDWCDVHFITDPEEFLWHGSWYLMRVVNARNRVRSAASMGGELELEKWQLIVLEDSGELLSADSAQRTGQGLQRLLNLTDGAMGRGMRVIVLVTTNEPLSKMHSAVTRPGRCLQLHEFDRLSADESNAWLRSHKVDAKVTLPTTIAELYGLLNNESLPAEAPRAVGFAA